MLYFYSTNYHRYRKILGITFIVILVNCLLSDGLYAQTINFSGTELLGRPTASSITVNIVPDSNIELFYEYSTTSGGPYTGQTTTSSAAGNAPYEVVISGLQPDTRYYYRMVYRINSGSPWQYRTEHSFITQRAPGSTFTFTIISDSHAMYNTQYQQAIQNINNEHPDFHLDLGDTYMIDGMTNQTAVNNAYLAQREPLYMDGIGHSVPIFLSAGNHENEEGWNFDDAFSLASASIKARKLYYPTPVPDGFYTGNADPLTTLDIPTYGDQYREDYYAWTWGDVLFIVIEPFQYTMANPYGASAGEGSDDPATGDRWNWTLGQQQFNWFKQTVENSSAKYKFVFAHHMLGGTQNYVRGGAVPAHMFEWGGNNADGTTWGFNTQRPGWGDDPVRQIMIDNHVSAFFHGHDHQYAYEVRDGIVYLSMPRPSTGLDFNYYNESNEYTERVLAGPGHLKVTVTPASATVEYITSNGSSGAVQHSFSIAPSTPSVTHDLTLAVSPAAAGTTNPSAGVHSYNENAVVNITALPAAGYLFDNWTGPVANPNAASTTITMSADQSVTANFVQETPYPGKAGDMNGDGFINSTDALIILSCDVGIDVSQFCPANCADANRDGVINSTDALIILSYDAGISVPYQLGQEGCPSNVTPCLGCSK